MSIRWDARNKRWRYEFKRTIAGQRKRASRLLPPGWSQAEADAFDRAESARLYAVATGVAGVDPLIDTAVAHYLRDKKHLKSYKATAEHLAAIAWAYAGKTFSRLPDIAAEVAEKRLIPAVKGGRPEHVISMSTVRNRLACLKAAARWGWKKHEMCAGDPTARMQIPTVKNGRQVYVKRKGMLQAARATVHHQTCVAIRVAFYSGLRLGEQYKVRPVDGLLVLDDTKNGKPRVIPAHPRILSCLQHLPLTLPRRTLQKDWMRARDATVGREVHLHDLRHSAASEMINGGVDLHTVGKVLGHLDARSTDRYAHLQVEALAAAVGTIGRQKRPHTEKPEAKKKAAGEAA